MKFFIKHFKHLGLTFLFLLFTQMAMAQISFPDDVDDEGPAAPIDGFVVIGIAAGAYFGIRKKRKSNH